MCPLFLPATAAPLTGVFSGECSANPGGALSDDMIRECCNRGYARSACTCAATVDGDSICFLVKSDHDGIVDVAWALERDHHPLSVGAVSVNGAPASGEILERQAFAIARHYRNQKGAA